MKQEVYMALTKSCEIRADRYKETKELEVLKRKNAVFAMNTVL